MVYSLTYNAARQLTLVSEPAGRWLRISYQDVPVNQNQFTRLARIYSSPAPAQWVELPVTDPGSYRYLRFFSTDADEIETWCNVAEVEFYDQNGVKLTGTRFGSSPSWQSRTYDKATDGNTNTFFDYAYRHFGFTGIDLGAGQAARISKVRFYARQGYEGRMIDGRFEGSNVAPVTKTVISRVEIGRGSGAGEVVSREVNYQYGTQPDAVIGTDWLVLKKALYGDATAATYTYQLRGAGQRPLLETADDPASTVGRRGFNMNFGRTPMSWAPSTPSAILSTARSWPRSRASAPMISRMRDARSLMPMAPSAPSRWATPIGC